MLKLALERELVNLGIDSDTTIDYPKNGKLVLPSFNLTSKDDNFPFQLKIEDLELNYDWYKLISMQRLNSISIGNLTLTLGEIKHNPSDKNTPTLLKSFLPEKWFAQLPFESLTINQLTTSTLVKHFIDVSSSTVSPGTQLSFKGKLEINSQSLVLAGEYLENEAVIADTNIQITNDNQFKLSSELKNTTNDRSLLSHNVSGTIIDNITDNNTESAQGIALSADQYIQLNAFTTHSIWAELFLTTRQKQQIASINGQISISHQLALTPTYSDLSSISNLTSKFSIRASILNPDRFIESPQLQISQSLLSLKGDITKKDNQIALTVLPNSNIALSQLSSKDLSTQRVAATLQAPLSISCQLPCALAPSQTETPSIKASQLNVKIDAADWLSTYGKASHPPFTLKVTLLNLAKSELTLDYQDLALKFFPSKQQPLATKAALPFAKLSLRSNGQLAWKDQQLSAHIEAPLNIQATELLLEDNYTKALKLKSNNAINIAMIPATQSLVIDQADLTFAKNTWQTAVGKLRHDDIEVNLSDFNLAQQQGLVTLNSPSIKLQGNKLPFSTMQTQLASTIALKDKKLTVSIDKGLQIKLTKLSIDTLKTSKLTIDSKQAIKIKAPFDFNNPQLDLSKIAFSTMRFNLRSNPIKVDQHKAQFRYAALSLHSMSLSPLKLHASSTIKALQLSLPKLDKALQVFDIKANHWVNKQRYSSKFTIDNPAVSLQVKGNFKASKGFKNLDANWQLAPFPLEGLTIERLRKLSEHWPAQLQITNGMYDNKGSFTQRGSKLTAQVSHQIKDASLLRDKLLTSGINLKSQTQYQKKKLIQQGTFSIANINSTIPVSNIRSQFVLTDLLTNNPNLNLRQLGADVLGTRIKIKKLAAKLTPLTTKGSIEFSKLPLNNILALENQPSLNGEGFLQGELPFRLQDKKIWVDKGRIKSMGKGVIRYQANEKIRALASSNQGLAIAVNVLENFNYKSLAITANYSPDGKLLLANRLTGNNPSWQNGQPIDFSINIEENILKLLKTIQFSDDLEQKLQQQVQDKIPP